MIYYTLELVCNTCERVADRARSTTVPFVNKRLPDLKLNAQQTGWVFLTGGVCLCPRCARKATRVLNRGSK